MLILHQFSELKWRRIKNTNNHPINKIYSSTKALFLCQKIKFKDPKTLKANEILKCDSVLLYIAFFIILLLGFFLFFLFFLLFYFWFCCRCWCSLKFGDTLIVASIILQKRVQWISCIYIWRWWQLCSNMKHV